MIKVLLDTDIGSDIDDAACLAYLLANPNCDLLGITTVSGEGEQRARMASALCLVAGRQIPIHVGREAPLIPGLAWQPKCPQADALARWAHATGFPRGQAVEFMRQTIRAHPGEVTVLAIGPLTNVAALFAADAEIPALLRSLVWMGGVFTNQMAGVGPLEWNAMLDPGAAAIVYRQAPKILRSIGLDVTCRVKMPAAEVRRRFQAPLLLPVLDFAEVWFRERPEITFHDPLAATTIFDAAICAFERGRVEVELASSRLLGMTHWAADPDGPHEVALQVAPQRFFDHYFACFSPHKTTLPGTVGEDSLAGAHVLSLKDRLKSKVKASTREAFMQLLQASFDEALSVENVLLSGPERQRLLAQVRKDVLTEFGAE